MHCAFAFWIYNSRFFTTRDDDARTCMGTLMLDLTVRPSSVSSSISTQSHFWKSHKISLTRYTSKTIHGSTWCGIYVIVASHCESQITNSPTSQPVNKLTRLTSWDRHSLLDCAWRCRCVCWRDWTRAGPAAACTCSWSTSCEWTSQPHQTRAAHTVKTRFKTASFQRATR